MLTNQITTVRENKKINKKKLTKSCFCVVKGCSLAIQQQQQQQHEIM